VIQYGHTRRVFKALPVGHKKVELEVDIPRLFCKDCGAIRQANLEFADPKKHYTRSLERLVIDLCRMMILQDVAELTGLSWDTVKDIHKAHLRRRYKTINLKKVRYLALDEVYLGHKRKFVTGVMDLGTGRVIHVGQGKGKDALSGFWRRLKRSRAKIELGFRVSLFAGMIP
jgi:transposase